MDQVDVFFKVEYINVDDVFISFARQESVNRNQNNKAMIILHQISFGDDTKSHPVKCEHLSDMWLST